MSVSDYDSDSDLDVDLDLDLDVDTECLTVFENSIEKYVDFYKCNVDAISTQFIYIDEQNNISHIHNSILKLHTPNFISPELLIKVISKNNSFNHCRYSLDSILLLLFDMASEELLNFEFDDSISKTRFATEIIKLSHIHLPPCVKILQDINRLTFIFKIKKHRSCNSKKSTYKNKNKNENNNKRNNTTKKYK